MLSRIHNVQRILQSPNGYYLQKISRTVATAELNVPTKFKYTLENPLLTTQQRTFYEENGYLVISNIVEESLLDECANRYVDICEGRIEKGVIALMKDISLWKQGAKGQNLYYKAQNLKHDEVFVKYIMHSKLLDYVECFTGPNITAMHPMIINKPPDSGKHTTRHPLHQDLHTFPFRPADRIVAAWTAMEPNNPDNGCLFFVPGSHREGKLYHHDYPKWEDGVNHLHYTIQGLGDVPKMMLSMKKGDTVFFHPLLMHGSGENITKGYRKSISCHYAASECNFVDVTGTDFENFSRELENVMKKVNVLGENATYVDYWRYTSKLARGKRINI